MHYISVITDIVVPIFSALIGGLFTFLGVWVTIKKQAKKDELHRKLLVKPIIYSYKFKYNNCDDYNNSIDYYLRSVQYPIPAITIEGYFINTDNGILVLDCVLSGTKKYTTWECDVVDKSKKVHLIIALDDKREQDSELYLYVKDIYGNSYRYLILVDKEKNYFVLGKCEEV